MDNICVYVAYTYRTFDGSDRGLPQEGAARCTEKRQPRKNMNGTWWKLVGGHGPGCCCRLDRYMTENREWKCGPISYAIKYTASDLERKLCRIWRDVTIHPGKKRSYELEGKQMYNSTTMLTYFRIDNALKQNRRHRTRRTIELKRLTTINDFTASNDTKLDGACYVFQEGNLKARNDVWPSAKTSHSRRKHT